MRKKDVHSRQRKETLTLRKKAMGWFTLSLQLFFPLQGSWSEVAHASFNSDTSALTTLSKKYQLGSGENFNSVAKKFAVTPQALIEANKKQYSAAQLNALKPGNTLLVPEARPELTLAESQQESRRTDHMQTLATIAAQPDSEKAAAYMAKSAAVGAANRSVESWLSQYGTARVALNLNENSDLNNSAADVLYPFYDSPSAMLFAQGGARRADDRTTLNIDLGTRIFNPDWMYGFNTFFDNDLTGKNRRVGVGGEFGIDYLKLSANYYFRLTDWHQSRDFADYDERPANGFDLRAESWLPVYPQLGASLMYESYRGEQVALFGKDKRQKNPWALGAGISYTPVPLLTLSTSHRQGRDGMNDHQVNLQFNYRIGESWASHLDSDRVKQSRSLIGSRYDLVERNNNIVLDYRKQELVKVALPSHLKGFAADPDGQHQR
ncbi:inverse autotransporter beta domain-containing protein [Pantoea sp.]|uniref:inverse autotransporter beta domain-containing protein n=1 Tax=Pantoea sp. TaxID=69393 RepID=UPI0028A1BDE0|nr:inverse autotransporter beta domain-containing protein [Pantoea sp.]